MKSTLIQFIENYRNARLTEAKLRRLWREEVDKDDFDRNEKEVWAWFLRINKSGK